MLCSFWKVDLWLPLRFLLWIYSVMFLCLKLTFIITFLRKPFCLDFHIYWFIVLCHQILILCSSLICQELVFFLLDLPKKQVLVLLITSLFNLFISVSITNYIDVFWFVFYFWNLCILNISCVLMNTFKAQFFFFRDIFDRIW